MKKLLFVLVFVLLSLPAKPSYAQTNHISHQISPFKAELTASPGETVRHTISIKNPTNEPKTLQVRAVDFEPDEASTGEPKLIQDGRNSKYGLKDWFTASNTNVPVTVPALQTIDFDAKFIVPADAKSRTYYSSILFSDTSTGRATTSVGSLVFISVGSPIAKPEITDIAFGESSEFGKQHGVFAVTVANNGEGIFSQYIRISVSDETGNLITELRTNPLGSVLPESRRVFHLSPKSALPAKKMTVVATTTDASGNAVSKEFTLDKSPETVAPTDDIPTSARQTNYLPMTIAGGVIVALLLVVTFFIIRRRKSRAVINSNDQIPLVISGENHLAQPQESHETEHISSGSDKNRG